VNGSEVSTGHIALILTAFGIGMPLLTGLTLFLLQRLFGGGDELRNKVHALELAVERAQSQAREHVADKYATRDDVRRLETVIQTATETMNARMSEYTAAVTAMLGPIGEQMGINPVRKDAR
jgi:hypothetical protein